MDRAGYEEYVHRFNARDYDGVFAFYGDDPDIAFFGVTLRTLDELKHFYGFLHDHVRESVIVRRFAASDNLVAVEATVRIDAFKDMTAEMLAERGLGQFRPIKAGEVIEMDQMIHYRVKDGKFESVRCAPL